MPQQPEEAKRDYTISDNAMIQDSNTTIALFGADKADFVAFDSVTFADPFQANWQTAISASENADTDEQYEDQQQAKTSDVETNMQACRDKYATTKYFVLQAFPNNKAVQQEFGLDDYDSVRDNQTGLRKFMITMNKAAVKYQAQLTAVGYNNLATAEILTLGQALEDSDTDQEVFKKGRGVATQTRVGTHDTCWGFRTKVAAAAKIIYASNFAKNQQYLLPPSEASGEDVSINGVVRDEDTNAVLAEVKWTIDSLSLSDLTDEFGVYAVATIPPATYSITFTIDNYITKTLSVTVAAGTTTKLDVTLKHV